MRLVRISEAMIVFRRIGAISDGIYDINVIGVLMLM